MFKDRITGIVLSGGKSSRMGTDKGLTTFNGKPLITYPLTILEQLCDPVFISANENIGEYQKFGYPVIEDKIKGIGPMGGISACLEQSTTRLNIVLSCDVPFLNRELMEHLISRIDNFQAAVPVHDGFVEPLSAVYATNVLWYLNDCIAKDNYKLMDFLSGINCLKVDVGEKDSFWGEDIFTNINTQTDLQGD
jgi:molybdopterin-guanine dinucleotide biosynthesis protein A